MCVMNIINYFLLAPLDVVRVARTDLEAVIVPKVNVEAVNVHVLLQTGNVIQMSVGIVGSGELVLLLLSFFSLVNDFMNYLFLG